MKVVNACVLSTLGSSLVLNSAALLANETCYQSGTNSDGCFYPFAALNLKDDDGFHYLGFSKIKVLIQQALSQLFTPADNLALKDFDILYFLISKDSIHKESLKDYFKQLNLSIPVAIVQGDSCKLIEIVHEAKQENKKAIVLAYDDLNEPSKLSNLFSDDRVKHSENSEGLVPGEVCCGILVSPNSLESAVDYEITSYGLELETVDVPGKIVRAGALVRLVSSLLKAQGVEYHDFSIRFADINGESPRNFETAISTARLQNHPMTPRLLSLNTVTPCGDAGAANGVLQLALLYGMCCDQFLREKIEMREPYLALHQLYGEEGRRGAFITKFRD